MRRFLFGFIAFVFFGVFSPCLFACSECKVCGCKNCDCVSETEAASQKLKDAASLLKKKGKQVLDATSEKALEKGYIIEENGKKKLNGEKIDEVKDKAVDGIGNFLKQQKENIERAQESKKDVPVNSVEI